MNINIQDYLPLREPTFFILLSISTKKKHGYAIMQDVNALSQGQIKLSNGTLYSALVRLQDQGIIERTPINEPQISGKPRKAYQITRDGLAVLQAEIDRMATLVNTARVKLPKEAI